MTAPGGLTALSIGEVGALVRSGEVSPIELTDAYLDRIEQFAWLNAYVTVSADQARQEAERAQALLAQGRWLGPLHGIPLGIKDVYDVAGVPTTGGSAQLRTNVPPRDATVTRRLRAAGAVVLGKHSTHEFAWGGTTDNAHFGPTRNPHDATRIPGGSSGGSAASVVAHTAAGGVGTDTAGSVRIPAALSGCVGLKPTYGRISMHRVLPLAPSLDHAGVLARSTLDVTLLYRAIAGYDTTDARTLRVAVEDPLPRLTEDVAGLRVGRLRGWFEELLDPCVRTALDSAVDRLTELGCRVDDVTPHATALPVPDVFLLVTSEALPWHWATFGRDRERYGHNVRGFLTGPAPTMEDVSSARERLGLHVADLLNALENVDLLLCATVAAPAPLIGATRVVVEGTELKIEAFLTRLTSIANVARLPALSLPGGLSDDGLPVGVQLIGRHLDESTLLRLGHAFEGMGGPG
jgi:aspartyl-tRNA(Asn)/glutamyl-tRNA(Gln) amidotransferase subunit A